MDILIEQNVIWCENEENKKYTYLGETNTSWYIYEFNKENKWKEVQGLFNQFFEQEVKVNQCC